MNNIQEYYMLHVNRASDINEHLPTLAKYASECESVVEMGVRDIVSTWALLAGKPKKMISIDIYHPDTRGNVKMADIKAMALKEGIDFEFMLGNTLEIKIPDVDLLFIDTQHRYSQLKEELERHGDNVRKYIIMHDTVSYGRADEPKYTHTITEKYSGRQGLLAAIEEYMMGNSAWTIYAHYTNNNGLTVLKRST